MIRAAVAALLLLSASAAASQEWPARPVRIVVPLAPGGFADVPARMLAPRLSAAFGRPFYVENRPGAGGTIGTDHVAKGPADGYTLLLTATPHVISPHLYVKIPYSALDDFVPVAGLASGPYALVVNPRVLPVDSVQALIAAARGRPGQIDYASSGNGSAQHLVAALFNSLAGIEMRHIPYKGSSTAMQDLVSGQTHVSFAGIPNILSHVRAGRLRVLGVTTATRWSELPEVPTLAEAGVPGYEATLWLGMLAPKGVPAQIVKRVFAETAKALDEPELQDNFRLAGIEARALDPEAFGAFMAAEHAKWGRVVRDSGARLN